MRHLSIGSITLGVLLCIAPRAEADERWVPVSSYGFEDQPVGTAPANFVYSKSASGKAGNWLVQARADAPAGKYVLVQSDADRSADRFLMALADQPPLRDVRVAVRCRTLQGRIDQACGLVFRYQDAQNYYVTRANALEGNVRLYHVRNGKRTQIASWDGPISSDAWHELIAEAIADRIRVLFDGKRVINEQDETFASPGAVGLWVKADSVTAFDELRIESPARAAAGGASGAPLDAQAIEQLTGAKGQLNEDEQVFKVSVPRSDLAVQVADSRITPSLGLTSWAAFMRAGNGAMVMGDMVLLEGQVNPVMSVALDGGLEVTALHNHFLFDSPRVMFMHIGGMGFERELAGAVGKVFAAIRQTSDRKDSSARAGIDPAKTSLDPKKIEAILGHRGELKDGVYKIVLGRTVRMHGHSVGNAMGVNTWMAFAGSDDRAIVDGDFAMRESELQGVLKALRAADINIVAIHNHMTHEQPRIVFLHFWGLGATQDLARGLRTALEHTRHASEPREARWHTGQRKAEPESTAGPQEQHQH